ncbi:MAG TPA: formate dehydrogenase accessory sulfurtransferase FdhD [Actinomycetota bacterium]|nr:formate dehydrogenase accessory sulfurtransferase FdhD [Actinomycetota bacterium]
MTFDAGNLKPHDIDAPERARPGSRTPARVHVVDEGRVTSRSDYLATEEPLEIRVAGPTGTGSQRLAITMRTPGADFELAVGFLHGEGILGGPGDLQSIRYCVDDELDAEQRYNVVTVDLAGGVPADLAELERHFTINSACGVCGSATLASLHQRGCAPVAPGPQVAPDTITALPDRLRAAQGVFRTTGGLHAAGLFDASGTLLAVREDVGRHNALDKLIGWALLGGRLPLEGHIVMVSGRTSYEIVQKCVAAGVPVVCAVSAPSSLAVSLAREFGMTLVGFLRGSRFNVYAGWERIAADPE